jgi:hypothetical protein
MKQPPCGLIRQKVSALQTIVKRVFKRVLTTEHAKRDVSFLLASTCVTGKNPRNFLEGCFHEDKMNEYTQVKNADLDRIRLAIASICDVLAVYPAKVEPISTTDRDNRLLEGICLWCNEPLGSRKKSRGCHEYCVTKAISQASEDVLIKLNRLMPALKGGRPSKRLEAEKSQAKLDLANLKSKRKNNN